MRDSSRTLVAMDAPPPVLEKRTIFVADVAAVYLERPGESYEIAHPHEGGDACTEIALDDALVSATAADEPRLRVPVTFTPPQVDLEHRLLVADARRGNDVELGER